MNLTKISEASNLAIAVNDPVSNIFVRASEYNSILDAITSLRTVTLKYNNMRAATTAGAVALDAGVMSVPRNTTSATIVIPINGLTAGDVITSFKLVGCVGATTGKNSVVDAILKKIIPTAATAPTPTTIATMTTVTKAVAYTLSESTILATAETVVAGTEYFILVTVTTADDAACIVAINGAELSVTKNM